MSGFLPSSVLSIISPSRLDRSPDDLELIQRIPTESQASVEELLADLDPKLLRMWRGAKKAFRPDNPDRERHVATSLRELLTHVLWKIAPDDEVRKWTADPKHFDDKRRPTRAAKMLFVCRHINEGPFTSFVQKDVESAISFINLFQRGTHELSEEFSERQIAAMIVRAELLLRFLLIIAKKK